MGFDLTGQVNADASVQTILNRLADAKEIGRKSVKGLNGKTYTAYIGPRVKV